jgi:RNA polymerase sigma-70 factor (ECF subfamily)
MCNKVRGGKRSRDTITGKNYKQSEINSLVNKAACGNFEAFGKLYSLYLNRIYRYALYQVRDKMTAEDITEEVFVKAWNAIGSCKGKGQTFLSWIYRIAHNHIINTLRNSQKCLSLEGDNIAEINNMQTDGNITLEQQELMKAIAELPQIQRQVIILKFIDGFNNNEISKIIGKREGAIRVLQMRALTMLRQKLGGGRYDNGT